MADFVPVFEGSFQSVSRSQNCQAGAAAKKPVLCRNSDNQVNVLYLKNPVLIGHETIGYIK
jgi:hypothetical protein